MEQPNCLHPAYIQQRSNRYVFSYLVSSMEISILSSHLIMLLTISIGYFSGKS